MSFTTFILVSLNIIILFGFTVLAFIVGCDIGYNRAKKEAEVGGQDDRNKCST